MSLKQKQRKQWWAGTCCALLQKWKKRREEKKNREKEIELRRYFLTKDKHLNKSHVFTCILTTSQARPALVMRVLEIFFSFNFHKVPYRHMVVYLLITTSVRNFFETSVGGKGSSYVRWCKFYCLESISLYDSFVACACVMCSSKKQFIWNRCPWNCIKIKILWHIFGGVKWQTVKIGQLSRWTKISKCKCANCQLI